MAQSVGFVDPTKPTHVCLLDKSIYVLKQVPRVWYGALQDALFGLGFISSQSNHSLFILKQPTALIILLIYVDDIIITGSSSTMITHIIQQPSH